MSSSARVRRCRARKRAKLKRYELWLPEFDTSDALVQARYLGQWDAEDHAAVQRALQEAVLFLILGSE